MVPPSGLPLSVVPFYVFERDIDPSKFWTTMMLIHCSAVSSYGNIERSVLDDGAMGGGRDREPLRLTVASFVLFRNDKSCIHIRGNGISGLIVIHCQSFSFFRRIPTSSSNTFFLFLVSCYYLYQ